MPNSNSNRTNTTEAEATQAQTAQADTAASDAVGQDAVVTPEATLAAKGIDPSNTYEQGVNANVNTAVPDGATVVTNLDDALDAGYFGYSPGIGATESLTLAEAGKRNERIRSARKAAINVTDDSGK